VSEVVSLSWRNYRYIVLTLVFAAVSSFFLVFVASGNWMQTLNSRLPSPNLSGGKQSSSTVKVQTIYTLCGHLIQEDTPDDLALMDGEQLDRLYPAAQGWDISRTPEGILLITRQKQDFCPEDAGRRHLGVLNGYVAVYRGPVGSNGPLERVTSIRMRDLPPDWQRMILRGELSFENEGELLEALDSLDEYQ